MSLRLTYYGDNNFAHRCEACGYPRAICYVWMPMQHTGYRWYCDECFEKINAEPGGKQGSWLERA